MKKNAKLNKLDLVSVILLIISIIMVFVIVSLNISDYLHVKDQVQYTSTYYNNLSSGTYYFNRLCFVVSKYILFGLVAITGIFTFFINNSKVKKYVLAGIMLLFVIYYIISIKYEAINYANEMNAFWISFGYDMNVSASEYYSKLDVLLPMISIILLLFDIALKFFDAYGKKICKIEIIAIGAVALLYFVSLIVIVIIEKEPFLRVMLFNPYLYGLAGLTIYTFDKNIPFFKSNSKKQNSIE